MTKVFVTVCCALLACVLPARHIPNPFDPVNESPYAKLKNELAWDLKGFVYAAPVAAVTYRTQFGRKEENKVHAVNAFRLHANGYLGFPFREVTDVDVEPVNAAAAYFTGGPIAQHYASCNLFVGIERQHFLKRLGFYHGVEIGGGYSRFASVYYDPNNQAGENANRQNVSEAKIFLSCFTGLKFYVAPQVSLSVECNVFGGINFQHQKMDYYEYDAAGSSAAHETVTLDKQKFFLGNNRLRALNIAFHF